MTMLSDDEERIDCPEGCAGSAGKPFQYPLPPSKRDISTRAFLTGSRAYGTPREDSDIDLCVLLSRDDYHTLKAALPEDAREDMDDGRYDEEPGGMNIRFGQLNLLAFNDADIYWAWQESTGMCKDYAVTNGGTCDRTMARRIIKDHVANAWDRKRAEIEDERIDRAVSRAI